MTSSDNTEARKDEVRSPRDSRVRSLTYRAKKERLVPLAVGNVNTQDLNHVERSTTKDLWCIIQIFAARYS